MKLKNLNVTLILCIVFVLVLWWAAIATVCPEPEEISLTIKDCTFPEEKPELTTNDLFDAIVTAYCPCKKCCGRYADGVTASGYIIQPGASFVAANENIPFGTMLDIPGYGVVPVRDRGGAIKGNRLDVFFPTHAEALEWGWQKLEVKIKARMEIEK